MLYLHLTNGDYNLKLPDNDDGEELGRNYIGIELNPEYISMAIKRLREVQRELL